MATATVHGINSDRNNFLSAFYEKFQNALRVLGMVDVSKESVVEVIDGKFRVLTKV